MPSVWGRQANRRFLDLGKPSVIAVFRAALVEREIGIIEKADVRRTVERHFYNVIRTKVELVME